MSGSLNRVQLIGHLGQDPEVRTLDSGKTVAKFSLATSEKYKDKVTTDWHRVELWEGLAKVAEKCLRKGNQVYIEGRIRTDSWTDKDGQQRSGITILASGLTLLGGNKEQVQAGVSQGQGNDDDSDLPF